MVFEPAPENTGIVFRRVDIPGSPCITASVENVCATPRSTNLGVGEVSICTVEHVLAALNAFGIDNLYIDIDGVEIPAGGGNSQAFVEMIEKAKIEPQDAECLCHKIKEPIYFSQEGSHLVALPSEEFRLSCVIDYPNVPIIGAQHFSLVIDAGSFKNELAPCRTFCLYEEIKPLIDKGLIKGGTLDNAVVAKGDTILNDGKLKFPNEMVRHKILDLVGDLSLVGFRFCAHVIAIKSGHRVNVALAKRIKEGKSL